MLALLVKHLIRPSTPCTYLIGERGMKLRHMRPSILQLHAGIVAVCPLRNSMACGWSFTVVVCGIVARLWLRLEAGGKTPCLQVA